MAKDRRNNLALKALLQRPIAFHRAFIKFGSPNAALMLSQACFWQSMKEPEDMWYKTEEEWFDETGLTRRMIDTARASLLSFSVIEYEVRGCPPKGYYRVDEDRIIECLSDDNCTDQPERMHISSNSNAHIRQIDCTNTPEHIVSKTTTNITTKTTAIKKPTKKIEPSALFDENEAPTREYLSATARNKRADELREAYNRIHEIAGLPKPIAFPKSDQTCLVNAFREGATVDRLGIAWQKALETSEARFWPFHCVIEKLHLLEAQLKKKPTPKKKTYDEVVEHNRKVFEQPVSHTLGFDILFGKSTPAEEPINRSGMTEKVEA